MTLTAIPHEGSVFSSWEEGCGSTTGNQCTVTVREATTVRMHFSPRPEPDRYSLSVSTEGSGQGTVTSEPTRIDCGEQCRADFTANTTVLLTATPTEGSAFSGWRGDCEDTDGDICRIAMDTNKNVTATFKIVPPPRISSFSAHADLILEGEQLVLKWQVSGPEGDLLSCSLEPGDGSSPLEVQDCEHHTTATHTFTARGSFTPVLTVRDPYGRSAAAEVSVIVMANLAPRYIDKAQAFGYSVAMSGDVMVVGAPGFKEVAGKELDATASASPFLLFK